jgi:hypothetical protein
MTSFKPIIAITLGSLVLFSCGGGKDHEAAHDTVDSTATAKDTTAVTVSDTTKFKFDFTLANIPSPAAMIQDLVSYKVPYDAGMLNDNKKAAGYSNENQRSYNLGIYNIDLAYAMSNDAGQDVLSYAKSVLTLADKIGVSSAVNTMVGKRAEANLSNKDSIFRIIDEIFIKSDTYLRTNKRVHIAANIFTGSWVEAIYLNSALYPKIESPELKEKARKHLWDQRFHLGNLITLLKDFKNEAGASELIKELTAIHEEIVSAKQPADMTEAKFNSVSEKITTLRSHMVG